MSVVGFLSQMSVVVVCHHLSVSVMLVQIFRS